MLFVFMHVHMHVNLDSHKNKRECVQAKEDNLLNTL